MSSSLSLAVESARPYRVFVATWGGWMPDGFDNAIYIYVVVPALTELLPKSGFAANHAHIGQLGGLMFSLFMLGWACSIFWGWCADRFGRVPTLCITILIYSIFTGACGLAPGIVLFAIFRFLTGFGIGGEWAAGAQRLGSMSGLILSLGTLLGCVGMPWIVRWIPRRKSVAMVFFSGALVCNIASYAGIVMLLKNLLLFMFTLPLPGFFTSGVFSLFTIWLPEMFPTMQRALGSGFAFSFGRVLAAAGPSIVGALATNFGSYPLAITVVSSIYLVGLLCVPWAPETANRALPP